MNNATTPSAGQRQVGPADLLNPFDRARIASGAREHAKSWGRNDQAAFGSAWSSFAGRKPG